MLKKMTGDLKRRISAIWTNAINPLVTRRIKAREEKVLLGMGFSPEQVRKVIEYAHHYQLLQEGLGQLVWRTAKIQKITPWEAGERLSEGLYWYEWCLKIAVERRIK
ncbi:MAG: hypothetical protein KGZ96_01020 [Clostridia bacterium]|nr:hypothetical protein [Clostridia bacterium]